MTKARLDAVAGGRGAMLGFYAALGAAVVILGSGSLYLPMGGDQGNYAYAAWAWIEGQVPYRDVLVFKPPMTLLFHALGHHLGEHSGLGIRRMDLMWQTATAVALAAFTLRWTRSRITAAAAALIYALCYYQFNFWHTAQTESWVTLPILVAMMATTRAVEKQDWRLMVVAGLGIGFAAGLKYTFLAASLPVVILVVCLLPARQWWSMAAAFVAGGAAVAAGTVAWLIGIEAWDAFVDHHVNTLPAYADLSVVGRGLYGVAVMLAHPFLARSLWALAGAWSVGVVWYLMLGLEWGRASDRSPVTRPIWAFRLAVAGLLLAGIISTLSQGKYFAYHYLPWIAPSAIMSSEFLARAVSRLRPPLAASLLAGVLLAAGLLTAVPTLARDWVEIASGTRSIEQHWRSERFISGQHSVYDSYRVSKWLRAHTATDDEVFIWGRDPGINYLAARRAPTRHIYNYQFRFPWVDPGLQQELIRDLERSDPEIVVVGSSDAAWDASGTRKDSRELLHDYPELQTWIDYHYSSEVWMGTFEVLRRRP